MSALIISVTFVMLGAGTFSYFDDLETSTGNTFTAGTIDISLNTDYGTQVKTYDEPPHLDLKPCETGWLLVTIYNDGSNPCEVWKHLYDVECTENGVMEPEEDYYMANCIDPETGKNDIDTVIMYDLWIDIKDENGVLQPGWGYLIEESDGYYVDDIECHWIYLGILQPGWKMIVSQSYHMEAETENWAQSDLMTFSMDFFAQQIVGDPMPPEPTTTYPTTSSGVLAGYGRPVPP